MSRFLFFAHVTGTTSMTALGQTRHFGRVPSWSDGPQQPEALSALQTLRNCTISSRSRHPIENNLIREFLSESACRSASFLPLRWTFARAEPDGARLGFSEIIFFWHSKLTLVHGTRLHHHKENRNQN